MPLLYRGKFKFIALQRVEISHIQYWHNYDVKADDASVMQTDFYCKFK